MAAKMKIPITKALLPYRINVKVFGGTFRFELRYNEAISSIFSSLIETIAKFEELGCSLDGIVKVRDRYTHFGTDEHKLIPAFKMTVKEA